MVITSRPRRGALALALVALGHVVVGSQQPARETLQVSLNLTGSLDAVKRESDNYVMTVEMWMTRSQFSQSSNFTLARLESGRLAGVPTQFYGMLTEQEMLEPLPSPLDAMEFRLEGEIVVGTCRGGYMFKHDVTSTRQGRRVNLPPGVPAGLLPELNMKDVSALANRGMFFLKSCAADPDKLLAFYTPPIGMFEAPAANPIRCSDEYTYERSAGEGSQYDLSLLSDKYAKALAAECPGSGGSAADDMAFLGSVSFSALKAGASPRLQVTYDGSDGDPNAQEAFTSNKLKLTLDFARR